MLEVILIPELKDNYSFIIRNTITNKAFIIDPSTPENVLTYCSQNNLCITHILNTHHHYDHIGGNKAIKHNTNCHIIASRDDASKIPGVDIKVKDNDILTINDFRLKVIELPGHTLGHIGFYLPDNKALFCGDVLFSGGCGRVFEGSYEMMFNSLQKIKSLPPETLIYCAHEYTLNNLKFALTVDPENKFLHEYYNEVQMLIKQNMPTIPTNLSLEQKINPFLRVEKLSINDGLDPINSWVSLRLLKDNF